MYSYLKMRKGVLVHCHAGMQRSACVVAAYIMKWGKFDLKMVVKMIQNCCKIYNEVNIKKRWESKLNNTGTRIIENL